MTGKPEVSWGEIRPERRCRWEEKESHVTLLVPRFGEGWLGQRLQSFFNPRPYRANLDEFGSFVWLRCDGRKTVAEIAREMREKFGERAEPVEDRLVTFLGQLKKGRFMEVLSKGEKEAGEARDESAP